LIYSEELLNFEEYEDEMYSVIKENITNLLDEDLEMTVDFGKERLKFDGDIEHMDGITPITFRIEASGKMHISENRLVKMGSFITKQIRLPVIGLENWNVTYSLILPNYIDVVGNAWVEETEIDYNGPRVGQDKEHDSRYKVSITIHGQDNPTTGASTNNSGDISDQGLEINVNMDIDITLLFFLNKIMIPLVLSIILFVIVITLVVLRRLKKRKMDKMKREIGLEVDDEDLLELATEIQVEPQYHDYQEFESYDWRETRPRKGRRRGRMSERFREFNAGFGVSRRRVGSPQEDYSERLRELVPEEPKPKKRQSHRIEPKQDRKRAKRQRPPPKSPKGRSKKAAKKR
jgi:hypothetical protein